MQNAFSYERLKASLVDFLHTLSGNTLFILSGDVTWQSKPEGYRDAAAFFTNVLAQARIPGHYFITCPGNHDLQLGSDFAFRGIDEFTYKIRQDLALQFERNEACALRIDGIYVVIANSAFHRDHRYGLICIDKLRQLLKDFPPATTDMARVFVSHHHFFPMFENDASVTRNMHPVIGLLDDYGFNIILHGHQHVTMGFPTGRTPIYTFGSSSLNISTNGYANGLNYLCLNEREFLYRRLILMSDNSPAQPYAFVQIGEDLKWMRK